MLLYVHTSEGHGRQARPLETVPDTVNDFYYLAMREHLRPGVTQRMVDDQWRATPDWRFDRQVIRIALFLREQLGVETGEPVAVAGPLGERWIQADFALQGLRSIPVGLPSGLADEHIIAALNETGARVVIATDSAAGERFVGLRPLTNETEIVVRPGAADGGDGVLGWDTVLDQGAVLDTPERASIWRFHAKAAKPGDTAGIDYTLRGDAPVGEEFTHQEAMSHVRRRLEGFPPRQADVAHFVSETVTRMVRWTSYRFVGDGHTTMTFEGDGPADLSVLKPAHLVVPAAWLERLADDLDAIGGVGRSRKIRLLLNERLGPATRSVEPDEPLAEDVARRLAAADVPLATLAPIGA